jgi:hypothetical protein
MVLKKFQGKNRLDFKKIQGKEGKGYISTQTGKKGSIPLSFWRVY